eukprot:scaffold20811_cov97-Isochrysis_galbana.AAC.4
MHVPFSILYCFRSYVEPLFSNLLLARAPPTPSARLLQLLVASHSHPRREDGLPDQLGRGGLPRLLAHLERRLAVLIGGGRVGASVEQTPDHLCVPVVNGPMQGRHRHCGACGRPRVDVCARRDERLDGRDVPANARHVEGGFAIPGGFADWMTGSE